MDGHHGVIHLLLTDVVMSGETGKEIAERVSKLRQGIRVLYMSGYPESVIASQGIIEPGITLLSKPFKAVISWHTSAWRSTRDHVGSVTV